MPAEGDQIDITEHAGGVEMIVKVVPGASRSRVAGALGKALKVAVAPPPERGKANAALVKLLAAYFEIKRADVEIISGPTQPLKRVRLAGLSAEQVRRRLA